jgi:hypothetical protein
VKMFSLLYDCIWAVEILCFWVEAESASGCGHCQGQGMCCDSCLNASRSLSILHSTLYGSGNWKELNSSASLLYVRCLEAEL